MIQEEQMSWSELHKLSIELNKAIPKGTRVRCTQMVDDPYPIPPGTEGTVSHIDSLCNIHVKWDNGSSLALIRNLDQYEIIKS